MTRRSDEDFREEIEAHLQLEIDQLIEEGHSPRVARRLARQRFGNVTKAQENFYEGQRWMLFDHLKRNVLYALRQMKAAPLSLAAILLSLALGVGLNTSVFSIADQVLFRALPVSQPESLVQLQWDGLFAGRMGSIGAGYLIPLTLFEQLEEDNESFEAVFARAPSTAHIGLSPESIATNVELVTGSYFDALRVRPVLGRLIDQSDQGEEGQNPVAVLSHAFWQSQFAGGDVLGETLTINSTPFTVVGVAQAGFRGTDRALDPAAFVPMGMKHTVTNYSQLDDYGTRFSHVFARLAGGVNREQAEGELSTFFHYYKQRDQDEADFPALSEEHLSSYRNSELVLLDGARGQSQTSERLEQPLRILLGATALVFLLACLNVSNLSLARVLAARRATALRTALGASRRRILGESLVESATFAVAGAGLGALLAPWFARAIVGVLVPDSAAGGAVALQPTLDLRMLAAAAVGAALITVIAGTAPALFASRVRPIEALMQRGDGGGAGLRLRKILVIGQFTLALLLLVGATVFSRTLSTLEVQGPGYDTSNLLALQLDPPKDGYTLAESKAIHRRLVERVEQLPEIDSAGLASFEMLVGGGWNNPVTIGVDSERIPTGESLPMNAVTPNFFKALQAPILLGRGFEESDTVEEGWDLQSVVVNQEFVDQYLDDHHPIGALIAFGNRPDAQPSIEIVGVVQSFRDFGLREPEPHVYFALWERNVGGATLYARSTVESAQAAEALRSAIRQLDPKLTVVSLRTVDDQLDRLLVTERVLARLATVFAAVALLLALIGLYAVLSFSAQRRTNEIGIRLALGAPRWSASGLLVREALVLAGAALLLAVPLVWMLGTVVESQLYGVAPMQLSVLVGAAGLLLATGVLASAIPARRVATIEPLEALRTE